jgi:hypothetical protein
VVGTNSERGRSSSDGPDKGAATGTMGHASSAAQPLDESPFEEPSYEKVERGIPGPWERAADRAEAKAERIERCPESSQEGARCIYEAGHGSKHFAKDAFAYYSWKTRPATKKSWLRRIRRRLCRV